MRRVFNCGIGMVLVLPAAAVAGATAVLEGRGPRAVVIGEVAATSGERGVRYR
jgi:phosphoribosylformylglycinamidine cyclo-ligase